MRFKVPNRQCPACAPAEPASPGSCLQSTAPTSVGRTMELRHKSKAKARQRLDAAADRMARELEGIATSAGAFGGFAVPAHRTAPTRDTAACPGTFRPGPHRRRRDTSDLGQGDGGVDQLSAWLTGRPARTRAAIVSVTSQTLTFMPASTRPSRSQKATYSPLAGSPRKATSS